MGCLAGRRDAPPTPHLRGADRPIRLVCMEMRRPPDCSPPWRLELLPGGPAGGAGAGLKSVGGWRVVREGEGLWLLGQCNTSTSALMLRYSSTAPRVSLRPSLRRFSPAPLGSERGAELPSCTQRLFVYLFIYLPLFFLPSRRLSASDCREPSRAEPSLLQTISSMRPEKLNMLTRREVLLQKQRGGEGGGQNKKL